MNLGKEIDCAMYRHNFLINVRNEEQQINQHIYAYVHNWSQWVELNWFVDIFRLDFRVWI